MSFQASVFPARVWKYRKRDQPPIGSLHQPPGVHLMQVLRTSARLLGYAILSSVYILELEHKVLAHTWDIVTRLCNHPHCKEPPTTF